MGESDILDRTTAWMFGVVDRLGALGVGLLILLENVIPPIPSEVVLPPAGFRASTRRPRRGRHLAGRDRGAAVAGALVVHGLGAWLGGTLGEHRERVQGWLGPVGYVVVGLIVVRVIVLIARRHRSRAVAAD